MTFQNDKTLFESELLKQIYMKLTNVSTICLIEEYNRLIIGSHYSLLKFFDVEHLRFDSDVEMKKKNYIEMIQLFQLFLFQVLK